jgi:hypothetical protein
MTQPVFVPCPQCGHSSAVELRQAGQKITCRQCQHCFELPTMGTLRRMLEPTEGPRVAAPTSTSDPARRPQRVMFVLGMALFFLFAAAGAGMFVWASNFATELPQAEIDKLNQATFAQIDQADLSQFWEFWTEEVIAYPIGEWVESGLVANRKAARLRRNIGIGLFGLAGAGLLTAAGSFLFRRS